MANDCDFIMQITGKEEAINELIRMMKSEGEFEYSGFEYVTDASKNKQTAHENGLVTAEVTGYCDWSIKHAMCRKTPSLESETGRLSLIVEAFAQEPGCHISEHALYAEGEEFFHDTIRYEEHCIEEFENVENYNKEFGKNFTEDMVKDGYVYIGGFGNAYGVFSDHLQYVTSEPNTGVLS